ncbi:hypothetical protein ABEB22_13670 (plasmid) [Thioclava sp. 'Guangxiensis']|uniref:hypothetical protein n=1 Tax=Thioclava sp. 'Guangxiensis' TaxID=3149044 RepID=UPI0032C4B19D
MSQTRNAQIQPDRSGILTTGFPKSALLRVFRLQMQSIDVPAKHGWMRALAYAQQVWGRPIGAQVFSEMAVLMDRVMTARRSPMGYGNPDCECCANRINPLEGYLLNVIAAQWAGKPAQAEGFALFLSEANGPDQLVKAAARVAGLLPKPQAN